MARIGVASGTLAICATVLETFYSDSKKQKSAVMLREENCQKTNPSIQITKFHLINPEYQKSIYQKSNPAYQKEDSIYPKWNRNWDHRELAKDIDNENDKSKKTKASRHIILIRHGQYNLAGTTDEEKYLTVMGRDQARLTGLRLAELSLPYTFIIHSDMSRAVETAQLISESLPNVPLKPADSILREGAPIKPEPRVGTWRPDHYYLQDGARVEAAFRKYFHRPDQVQDMDSYELVVCHANVIRYFVCRALQFPPEAWLRLSLKHASLTWLVIRPDGRVSCRTLGEAGHFPPELLSTS